MEEKALNPSHRKEYVRASRLEMMLFQLDLLDGYHVHASHILTCPLIRGGALNAGAILGKIFRP